jgi:hypothetical protein
VAAEEPVPRNGVKRAAKGIIAARHLRSRFDPIRFGQAELSAWGVLQEGPTICSIPKF